VDPEKVPRPQRIKRRIIGSENEFGATFVPTIERELLFGQEHGKAKMELLHSILPNRGKGRVFSGYCYGILPDQAKVSFDRHILEWSSPECDSAWELALHESAAMDVITDGVKKFQASCPEFPKFSLHKTDRNCEPEERDPSTQKRTSDNTAGSSHGNYLTFRRVTLPYLQQLETFIVTRLPLIGNGWVEKINGTLRFVCSQRAGFLHDDVSIQAPGTTIGAVKPLLNTRDEPHAQADIWRRLHDITGNQNMSEWQLYLKYGTMDLILLLIEEETFKRPPKIIDPRFPHLWQIISFFNADPLARKKILVEGGKLWSSMDFQFHYISEVRKLFARHPGLLTKDRKKVLRLWIKFTYAVARGRLEYLAHYLDWAAELYYLFLPSLRRLGKDLDDFIEPDPECIEAEHMLRPDTEIPTKHGGKKAESYFQQMLVEYANIDVNSAKSLYGKLIRDGFVIPLFSSAEKEHAQNSPPPNTRANRRGKIMTWVLDSRGVINTVDWTYLTITRMPRGSKSQKMLNPYLARVKEIEEGNTEKLFTDEPMFPPSCD